MGVLILNIIGAAIVAIVVWYVSHKVIIKKALKKFIIPDLVRNGYRLNRLRSAGFLQKGDFKKEKTFLRPFTLGYPLYHKYVNLSCSRIDSADENFEVMAKISVAFFIVYKVEYSRPFDRRIPYGSTEGAW
jgi:hypothetical protein